MKIANTLDRLMTARGVKSQSALARASGVSQAAINRILQGVTENPDLATLEKLAAALDTTVDDLMSGSDPNSLNAEKKPKHALDPHKGNVTVWENEEDLEPDDARVWIDRFDYHFSAGTGVIQWEIREKKALPFNKSFFREMGSNPKDCKLLVVRGQSMEPFLFNRDVFMIDTSRTHIRDGNVYAIYLDDEALVKQVFKKPGGVLVLHSYNPVHPDIEVTPDQMETVHIVGEYIYRSGAGPAGR
jgi:phage repressor protein C with HTH and peptisase S24 domain